MLITVSFLFLVDGKPSSQIVPLLRDENEKAAVTMGTPVMPTAMDFPQPCHGAPHEVWVKLLIYHSFTYTCHSNSKLW